MYNRRLFLAGLGGTTLYPALAPASFAQSRLAPANKNYLPNSILLTHEGKKVRFYDDLIKDKVVVINMMYAACTGICPASTASLMQVQEQLGDRVGRDIFMYSLTLQPERDSAESLRDYVQRYGIKPGWTFLTGNPKEMDIIRRKLGFYDPVPEVDANLAEHTGMVRIGNARHDRWTMAPALGNPRRTVLTILNI